MQIYFSQMGLIRFILILMLFPALSFAEATQCIEQAEHSRLTFFLVDRTDKFEDKDGFQKTVAALKEMIKPGERLIVGSSSDKAGSAHILMDFVKPAESVWSSTLKIRSQQKKFSDCLQSVVDGFLAVDQEFPHSALLETLKFVGKIISADSSETKKLVVYSDMNQNSSSISFFSLKTFNNDALIKQVEKEHLMANLKAVEVYATGTGSHVSDQHARALEDFWTFYIQKAGGNLKFYGPVLVSMQ